MITVRQPANAKLGRLRCSISSTHESLPSLIRRRRKPKCVNNDDYVMIQKTKVYICDSFAKSLRPFSTNNESVLKNTRSLVADVATINFRKASSTTSTISTSVTTGNVDPTTSNVATGSTTATSDTNEIPTRRQLQLVFLHAAIPMIGFGIMDQTIMLRVGDAIDCTIGVVFGLSTLTAAAFGQICSDASGVLFGGTLESIAIYAGLPAAGLSMAQRNMPSISRIRLAGSLCGIILGCSIGLVNLLFMDTHRSAELKKLEGPDYQDVEYDDDNKSSSKGVLQHNPEKPNDESNYMRNVTQQQRTAQQQETAIPQHIPIDESNQTFPDNEFLRIQFFVEETKGTRHMGGISTRLVARGENSTVDTLLSVVTNALHTKGCSILQMSAQPTILKSHLSLSSQQSLSTQSIATFDIVKRSKNEIYSPDEIQQLLVDLQVEVRTSVLRRSPTIHSAGSMANCTNVTPSSLPSSSNRPQPQQSPSLASSTSATADDEYKQIRKLVRRLTVTRLDSQRSTSNPVASSTNSESNYEQEGKAP